MSVAEDGGSGCWHRTTVADTRNMSVCPRPSNMVGGQLTTSRGGP